MFQNQGSEEPLKITLAKLLGALQEIKNNKNVGKDEIEIETIKQSYITLHKTIL